MIVTVIGALWILDPGSGKISHMDVIHKPMGLISMNCSILFYDTVMGVGLGSWNKYYSLGRDPELDPGPGSCALYSRSCFLSKTNEPKSKCFTLIFFFCSFTNHTDGRCALYTLHAEHVRRPRRSQSAVSCTKRRSSWRSCHSPCREIATDAEGRCGNLASKK